MNVRHLELYAKYQSFYAATRNPIPCTQNDGVREWDHNDFIQSGVDLVLTLDRVYTIDTLILCFGVETSLKSVTVYTLEDDVLTQPSVAARSDNVYGNVTLDVGKPAFKLIIRMMGNLNNIRLDDITLLGCDPCAKYVYPTPDSFSFNGETLTPLDSVFITCGDDADAFFAAQLFKNRCDYTLSPENRGFVISFEKAPALPKEGYEIALNERGGTVKAADRRGFIYAVEAVLQLTWDGFLPDAYAEDRPLYPRRGIHVGVPSRSQLPFFKSFIQNIAAPMHYNQLIMEVGAGMEYKSHPEINKMWETIKQNYDKGIWPQAPHMYIGGGSYLTQDEMRELIGFIQSFGIDVMPELNSLSHVQYMTAAHPEVAEVQGTMGAQTVDLRSNDAAYDEFYPGCYCPSNPRSYEILFDLVDEIIDVFKPEIMHMGHDEVYDHGKCEKCRGRDAEVIAQDIIKIHDHLKDKGVRMALWGDMMNDVNRYAVPEIIDMIPKDILLLDFIWYFALDRNTEKRLTDHGFEVEIGNLYSSHFPRYEQRMQNPGVTGGQVSTWVANDEDILAYKGKMFDIMFTADLLCNKNHFYEDARGYSRIINHLQQRLRRHMHGQPPLCRGDVQQHFFENAKLWPPHLSIALPTDISMPTGYSVSNEGKTVLSSLKTQECEEFTADRLVFMWSLAGTVPRPAWVGPVKVGSVAVEYADGTVKETAIEYGVHIYDVNTRFGAPLEWKYYRHEGYCGTWTIDCAHEGKTYDGRDLTVYAYELPVLQKPIRSVSVISDPSAPDILLYGMCSIK